MGETSQTIPPNKVRVKVEHSKVKSGCATCKARHVKCDETKPQCLRCLRFWGHCDGYPPPKKRASSKRTHARVAEVRTRSLLPRVVFTTASTPSQDLKILIKPFKTAYESQGFNHFLSHNVSQLAGLFSTSLWNTIILQSSASEPFVRETLAAIGALTSCGRKWAQGLPAGKKSTAGIEATPQYRFALQQYGNAVKSMRKQLGAYANKRSEEKQDRNLRIALISCVLIVCFEGLQGNYFFALQHAQSGHSILQDWLSRHRYFEPARLESPPSSTTSETTSINPTRSILGSPAPNIIEDDLVHAFCRLDLQIMSYVDTRPPSVHKQLKHEGSFAIATMPTQFSTLQEARLYFELIHRRTSHFIGDAATRTSLRKDSDLTIDMGIGTGTVPVTPESEVRLAASHFTPELIAEYQSFANELRSWTLAFTPFYSSLVEKNRTWSGATSLKIQALCHQVVLHSSILSDEWSLDTFAPVFREIVTLGEEIAKDPLYSTPHLFSLDLGLVNPLRLVSKWAREPRIRRQSIALLRQIASREGVWDALTMASVSEWQMEIEEERMIRLPGLGEEGEMDVGEAKWFIRKEDRVKTTNIVIDSLERTAIVTCERLGREVDGSVDQRKTVITW